MENEQDSRGEQELKKCVVLALSKTPQSRSSKDIDSLYKFHMRHRFFKELEKEYNQETVRKIMSYLRVVRVEAGHVVFDQDEPGDKLYAMLSGSASVEMAKAQDV